MFSLEIHCPVEEKDLWIAELWEHGSIGIVELDDNRLRAFFDDGADISRFESCTVSRRHEEDLDWVAHSRQVWEAQPIGRRLFLVPEWRADPTPPGRLRMEINPGLAFGTGVHETTQLCLEALESYVKPGAVVLDVGTGSGILAQASLLLGAARAACCDVDPVAVEIARRELPGEPCFVGSADAIRAGFADLLTANISPEAISSLISEILRCLKPGGVALLSGFEEQDVPTLRQAIESAGGSAGAARQKNTWALLEVTRSPSTQTPDPPG